MIIIEILLRGGKLLWLSYRQLTLFLLAYFLMQYMKLKPSLKLQQGMQAKLLMLHGSRTTSLGGASSKLSSSDSESEAWFTSPWHAGSEKFQFLMAIGLFLFFFSWSFYFEGKVMSWVWKKRVGLVELCILQWNKLQVFYTRLSACPRWDFLGLMRLVGRWLDWWYFGPQWKILAKLHL